MKKFITPLPAGKMPLFKDDVLMVQNNVFTSIEQLLEGIGANAYVVSGMVATDLGAGNVSISSGYAYIDGEVMPFAGYSGAYPAYVKAATPVTSTKIYKDGSTQTVITDKNSDVTTSVPGSGEYITFNFDTTQRLINLLAAPALAVVGTKLDAVKLFRYVETSPTNVGLSTVPSTVFTIIPSATQSTNNLCYFITFKILPGASTQGISVNVKKNGISQRTHGTHIVPLAAATTFTIAAFMPTYAAGDTITVEVATVSGVATLQERDIIIDTTEAF